MSFEITSASVEPKETEQKEAQRVRKHSKRTIEFTVPFVVEDEANPEIVITHNEEAQPITNWHIEVDSKKEQTVISYDIEDVTDEDTGNYTLTVEQDLSKHTHVVELDTCKYHS